MGFESLLTITDIFQVVPIVCSVRFLKILLQTTIGDHESFVYISIMK